MKLYTIALEAEYRAILTATLEVTWISFKIRDLGISLRTLATLFCDNISALFKSVSLVFHAHTKFAQGDLVTKFVCTSHKLDDVY